MVFETREVIKSVVLRHEDSTSGTVRVVLLLTQRVKGSNKIYMIKTKGKERERERGMKKEKKIKRIK